VADIIASYPGFGEFGSIQRGRTEGARLRIRVFGDLAIGTSEGRSVAREQSRDEVSGEEGGHCSYQGSSKEVIVNLF
jgi:hypothetical protein